jgi:hypothetical protein
MKIHTYQKLIISTLVIIGFLGPIQAKEPASSRDGEEAAHFSDRPAGTVGLVLGRAFLEQQKNRVGRLSAGDFVRERDTIVTGSNGHVHIKFVDDALISIRPNSRLEIVRYQFDGDRPEDSIVKFNLMEGTARSVSGGAAGAAKERFRLNTPVAAIGVRGTDFVVMTDATTTRAMVNQGAIVVAPFSSECTIEGSGPCGSNAVELEAESAQIIELDSSLSVPRIIQLTASQSQHEISLPAPDDSEARSSQDSGRGQIETAIQESSRGSALEGEAAMTSQADNVPDSVSSVTGVTDVVSESVTSLGLSSNAKEQAPYSTGFTPRATVSNEEAKQRQLVWGRYAEAKGPLERITLPFSEASQGRRVTIGGNFEYFLFRQGGDELRLNPNLGRVGFSLDSAQAYYKNDSEVSPVAVSSGDLLLDFDQNLFETSLNLYHLELGKAAFESAGRLRDGGYFSSYAPDNSKGLAGAVSLDGGEAGYFFDFKSWQGLVQGITLWDASR